VHLGNFTQNINLKYVGVTRFWLGSDGEANWDIGLEINAEKTKCMIMSRYPNSGQNQNIRIANE
jgi:hypothetical protein